MFYGVPHTSFGAVEIFPGASNPPLAQEVLEAEFEINLLLPCDVSVYGQEGGSAVSIMDPFSMLCIVENPDLELIARKAQSCLSSVYQSRSAPRIKM